MQITHFTFKQLLSYNLHLGKSKKLRNTLNSDFILITKTSNDIINLQKTLNILRITLPTIENIIGKGGKVLTVLNSHYVPIAKYLMQLTVLYKQKYLFAWRPGTFSNFKEFRRQHAYYLYKHISQIPNFIIFLSCSNELDLKTEIKALNIPCAKLQDTLSLHLNFLYQIPANSDDYESKLFFLTLVLSATILGYKRKSLSFSKKKLHNKNIYF